MTISAYALDLPSLNSLNYTIALVTLIGVPAAIWRSKSRKRISAAADAILGTEPITDASGNVIKPGAPGLVHRVSTVEDAVVKFEHAIGIYTEVLGRQDRIEARVTALEDKRVETIVTAAERAATAASATEALRLIRDRDTEDGETTGPELEP